MADQPPVDVAAEAAAWTAERMAASRADFEQRQAWKQQTREEHRARRDAGLRLRQARRLRLAEEDARGSRRLQVQGDLFHGQVPAGALYVGRAAPGLPRSPYANPFRVGKEARSAAHACELYRVWLLGHPEVVEAAAVEIGRSDVACWCRLDQPCHGDVLLRAIEAYQDSEGLT